MSWDVSGGHQDTAAQSTIEYLYRKEFGCQQLVNRSDGVVEGVYLVGRKVWQGTAFTDNFGRERAGRALTATG